MSGRRIFDPADVVIWAAAALLALLSGTGVGFVLWSVLSGLDAPPPFRVVVYVGGLIVFGVLPFRRTLQFRIFIAIAVAALIVSVALGPVLWAPLQALNAK